jgi:hypothetical protein
MKLLTTYSFICQLVYEALKKWNCGKFDTYKFKATFTEQLTRKVVQFCDGIFDCAFLKNELTVLYGSEDLEGYQF